MSAEPIKNTTEPKTEECACDEYWLEIYEDNIRWLPMVLMCCVVVRFLTKKMGCPRWLHVLIDIIICVFTIGNNLANNDESIEEIFSLFSDVKRGLQGLFSSSKTEDFKKEPESPQEDKKEEAIDEKSNDAPTIDVLI